MINYRYLGINEGSLIAVNRSNTSLKNFVNHMTYQSCSWIGRSADMHYF